MATSDIPLKDLAAELLRRIAELEARPPQQPTAPIARLLTARQAGEYIGRSEQAVRHLIFQQDIPVVRNGRCVRIDRRDLDTWIANHKT